MGKNKSTKKTPCIFKHQLMSDTYIPSQYLEAISNTIGKMKDHFVIETNCEYSEELKIEY